MSVLLRFAIHPAAAQVSGTRRQHERAHGTSTPCTLTWADHGDCCTIR